jgi:hypothetical protein
VQLEKCSFGIGDRFGKECRAQLTAIAKAKELGVNLVPVWNKSFREHSIIGSKPEDTKRIVDSAIKEFNWNDSYYIDADHINLKSVDYFIDQANFFTLDVGEFINSQASEDDLIKFISQVSSYHGDLQIPGLKNVFRVDANLLKKIGDKYLRAIKEAGKIYRHILNKMPEDSFVVEVSMDEVDQPQSPIELFFILAAISFENIPIQTIAPKFTGKFLKGIDYIGDIKIFEKEFEEIILVIEQCKKIFELPKNLKLSVHSGSDKFSIYPILKKIINKYDVGIHVKTAGTTWLEELIGLVKSGNKGLQLVKEIYSEGYSRYEELLKPYLHSVEIDKSKLPQPIELMNWSGEKLVNCLQHEYKSKTLDVNLRQLLHISFRIAAEKGKIYYEAMEEASASISECVSNNLYERHIKNIFI